MWGLPLLAALVHGGTTDRLDSYTTELTFALDVGVIVPTTVVAGVLILRRTALGYLLAVSLLTLEAMLAPTIAAQTVSQISAGESFPPGQIIGPIAGFAVLAVVAVGLVRVILRQVRQPGTTGAPAPRQRHSRTNACALFLLRSPMRGVVDTHACALRLTGRHSGGRTAEG